MRKENRTYYFSVEGETEKRYFHWLQNIINSTEESKYSVKLNHSVQPNPVSYVKKLTVVEKTLITHVVDIESQDEEHLHRFMTTLDNMKDSQGMGKSIVYRLGYSNFTFELWMILHKSDCNRSYDHRNQYLAAINQAYQQNFLSLSQYKQESNFNLILNQLTLNDVFDAIRRSKFIMNRKTELGHTLHQYKGFKYYPENPSLSIYESIESILIDCGLL